MLERQFSLERSDEFLSKAVPPAKKDAREKVSLWKFWVVLGNGRCLSTSKERTRSV